MTDADRPTAAAATAASPPPPPAAYCRRCGYSLRGLAGGKCPECGAAFDLSDRKTFARRPPRALLRWCAWRVSFLLVLLALAAGSVPGWYWWQWRKEQPVIAELRRLGGQVDTAPLEPAGPGRWLPARWAFLHDRAQVVDLHGPAAGEVGRVDFAALPHLTELWLADCGVTDAALARLGGLGGLRLLELSGNPLDGSGLGNLAACRRLEELELSGTRVDDAGLAHVARLPALIHLLLAHTRVTDAGLAALDGLTALQHVDVSRTAVTPAGLRRLRGLKALRVIDAHGIPMTDAEARDLQALMPNVSIYH